LKTAIFRWQMKHNESGIPSSNKPTTLVVGYKEDVIVNQVKILDILRLGSHTRRIKGSPVQVKLRFTLYSSQGSNILFVSL